MSAGANPVTALREPERVAVSLDQLLAGWANAPTLPITQVAVDSREVQPGALFLACHGHSGHGLRFVEAAIRQGAVAVAWEPMPGVAAPKVTVPAFEIPGLQLRVGEIAARFYGRPSSRLFVAGVTGTDGKTSTAWLVSKALTALGYRCGYIGTLGYGLPGALATATHTTPEAITLQHWLARLAASEVTHVMMEVSSHALDQARVGGVDFDVAVLTNVTRDHLDYHGDVIRYAAAKRKLFVLPGLKAAVLNQDDACGGEWLRGLPEGVERVAYGLGGPVHPMAQRHVLGDEPVLGMEGLRLRVQCDEQGRETTRDLRSQLLGRFNAYNLLAALAVLQQAGIETDVALAALAEVPPVPGRMQAIHVDGRPLAVVDYAHTPEALANALEAVRAHVTGKVICVFGCGGDRDRGKRPLMARAVAQLADRAIITDDNPRSEKPQDIVREITAGLPAQFPYQIEHDRARAIALALRSAGPDDAVLIAGKGHEDYQIYGEQRRHFSDVEVARQIAQEERHAAQ